MNESQEQWRKRWRDKPLRVLVTCRCEGYDPWFIQRDVEIVQEGSPGYRAIG